MHPQFPETRSRIQTCAASEEYTWETFMSSICSPTSCGSEARSSSSLVKQIVPVVRGEGAVRFLWYEEIPPPLTGALLGPYFTIFGAQVPDSTSTNLCEKLQSFSQRGSFDHPHPHLQLLNNYKFFFLHYASAILNFLGCIIHRPKDIFKTFLTVYLQAPKFLKIQLVNPKKHEVNKCKLVSFLWQL